LEPQSLILPLSTSIKPESFLEFEALSKYEDFNEIYRRLLKHKTKFLDHNFNVSQIYGTNENLKALRPGEFLKNKLFLFKENSSRSIARK
jgi:hypothetical protein